jgi:hypothetical protein
MKPELINAPLKRLLGHRGPFDGNPSFRDQMVAMDLNLL